MLRQEVDLSPHLILNCYVEAKYYTVTVFCRSEREFLLTCKIILTEAEGWGQCWFCRSIKTHIHWYKSL